MRYEVSTKGDMTFTVTKMGDALDCTFGWFDIRSSESGLSVEVIAVDDLDGEHLVTDEGEIDNVLSAIPGHGQVMF